MNVYTAKKITHQSAFISFLTSQYAMYKSMHASNSSKSFANKKIMLAKLSKVLKQLKDAIKAAQRYMTHLTNATKLKQVALQAPLSFKRWLHTYLVF